MTIPEASQLVIQASGMCESGDVFILDMGEPIKIQDLARSVIHLSGYKVSSSEVSRPGEISIKYSGLRPGEKLYEELLVGANSLATEHPRIMKAKESMMHYADVADLVTQLREAASRYSVEDLKKLIENAHKTEKT